MDANERSCADNELRKTQKDGGNKCRSTTLLGPKAQVYSSAGFLLLNANSYRVKAMSAIDMSSGRGKKEHFNENDFRQTEEEINQGLTRLKKIVLLGGQNHRHYNSALNECLATTNRFDAIYFTKQPNIGNQVQGLRDGRPTHEYSPCLQAIYLCQCHKNKTNGDMLPIFAYSDSNNAFTKYDIPDDEKLLQMWKELTDDFCNQPWTDINELLLHKSSWIQENSSKKNSQWQFSSPVIDTIKTIMVYQYPRVIGSKRLQYSSKNDHIDRYYSQTLRDSINQYIKDKLHNISYLKLGRPTNEIEMLNKESFPKLKKLEYTIKHALDRKRENDMEYLFLKIEKEYGSICNIIKKFPSVEININIFQQYVVPLINALANNPEIATIDNIKFNVAGRKPSFDAQSMFAEKKAEFIQTRASSVNNLSL